MPSLDRRAAARRRAWGRGPIILRFEPLEERQLLTLAPPLPDLVAASFSTASMLDWGQSFQASGQIKNQGAGPASAPYLIDIYASPRPMIGPAAVKIGEITMPAGLQPGASAAFSQTISMPNSPLPNLGSSPKVYIDLQVNPTHAVPESNFNNNKGIGQGYDSSQVTITPQAPAKLVGTSLAVDAQLVSWGDTIYLTTQIQNQSPTAAPPTRARIVLTPSTELAGSTDDVTVGSLQVPAIPGWQTVNVVQAITLPRTPPVSLAGSSQFTLTMVQDADFLTNPLYPPPTVKGLGHDQAVLNFNPLPTSAATPPPTTTMTTTNPDGSTTTVTTSTAPASAPAAPPAQPDLAAGTVLAPNTPLTWGQSFQVGTSVQNIGQGDASPFLVQFFLVGANGNLSHAIYLGETSIPGLKAGYNQDVVQTVKLPARLPAGVSLSSAGIGRIAAVVDPEHTVNEPFQNNKLSQSAPIVLRVLGTDGRSTVPTQPTPTAATVSTTQAPTPAKVVIHGQKIHRRPTPAKPHSSLASKVEHQLTIFPRTAVNLIKTLVNSTTTKK